MRIERPSLLAHLAALAVAAGQAWWILRVDGFAPERGGPLLPALWQKLAACFFAGGCTLFAASVRPGRTVGSEILSDVTRSIVVAAPLTFFLIQASYLLDRISLMTAFRVPWTRLVPGMILAWPVISLFVFGITAGNSSFQPANPARSESR